MCAAKAAQLVSVLAKADATNANDRISGVTDGDEGANEMKRQNNLQPTLGSVLTLRRVG
jgi:hypothetical protein